MKDKKIGFVGLGRMGANMARCLRDKGYTVSVVFDLRQEVATELAQEVGAEVAETPAAVTAASDVVLTVVTDDAAMESIYFAESNLLHGAAGKVFINCATLSPEIHAKVEAAAKAEGAKTLEACMASSIPQARSGELFLIVGGEKEVFEKSRPLLEDLSVALHHVGETGRGAQVKALVNMVMNINTAALAEGLGLAKALGLDLEVLCRIFGQTGANSRVLETDAEDMIARDHECYFSASHAAKDSGIALELARREGLILPLAEATCRQYDRLRNLGLGELDKSAVAELTFPDRTLNT
ncbi:MAG TPA: NAD(P)-dependent oxidoreductase [Oceanipulchritudo sp.]|nr:NAD(P)-dependent oxidoreductase [Oceanipulchritudo sp.]